ncbi:MAG TPA: YtxH domain-containing protein [Chitinophagaceae bacterium]|nr:YtxH domain-containing protein [Chitinophagaceae bacterium]
MKNTSKMLIALGAGLAIGGVLGILFAPDKGSETRKKISDQGKKLADKVKHKFNKGKEEFERVNGKVEELI